MLLAAVYIVYILDDNHQIWLPPVCC